MRLWLCVLVAVVAAQTDEPRTCALEGGVCACDGITYFGKRFENLRDGDVLTFDEMLTYGFVSARLSGTFTCNIETFGSDPQPRHQKACWCLPGDSESPTVTPEFQYHNIPGIEADYGTCKLDTDSLFRDVSSVADCEALCDRDLTCDSFNYDNAFDDCYLLKDIGEDGCFMKEQTSADIAFYTRKTNSYEPFPGVRGNVDACVLATVVQPTLVGCLNSCDTNPLCHAVNYQKTTLSCILLSDTGGAKNCFLETNDDADLEFWIRLPADSGIIPSAEPSPNPTEDELATKSPVVEVIWTSSPTPSVTTKRPTTLDLLEDKTVRVDGVDGQDTLACADGSIPCLTIGYAVEVLDSRAKVEEVNLRIEIKEGIYQGESNKNIVLSDQFQKNLEIEGIGNVTVLGTDLDTFITAQNTRTLHLENMIIKNFKTALVGSTGSIIEVKKSSITECSNGAVRITDTAILLAEDSTFTENEADVNGGVLELGPTSEAVFTDCELSGNSAKNTGGGITVKGGKLTLTRVLLGGNRAPYGGAIFLDSNSQLELEACHFSSNHAVVSGGAVFARDSVIIDSRSIFDDSTAEQDGGALYLECSDLKASTFSHSLLRRSSSGGNGGHFFVKGCIVQSIITQYNAGAAMNGGAMYLQSSVLLSDTDFFNSSTAVNNGGALYITGASTFNSTNSLCQSNIATNGDGGCLYGTFDDSVFIPSGNRMFLNQALIGRGGAYFQTVQMVSRRLQTLSGWLIDPTVLAGNLAVAGDEGATSAVSLCLGRDLSDSRVCEVLEGTSSDQTVYQEYFEGKIPGITGCGTGALEITAATSHSLSDALFVFQMDLFGNAFATKGTDVELSVKGGNISGVTRLMLGEAGADCFSNTAILAEPGSVVSLNVKDSAGLEASILVSMEGCEPGETLNSDTFECTTCSANTFALDNTCSECPTEGAACFNGNLVLTNGWYQEQSGSLFRCPREQFCNAGHQCASGHTGPVCISCSEGKVNRGDDGSCVDCPSTAVNIVLVAVVVVAILLIVFLFERSEGFVLSWCKVVLTHLQFLGLLQYFRTDWTSYVIYTSIYVEAVTFSGLSYLYCVLDSGIGGSIFYSSAIFQMILVLILGMLCSVKNMTSLCRVGSVSSAIGVVYLMCHMFFMKVGLQFFACYTATSFNTPAEQRFLIADPQVECSGSVYTAWSYGFGLVWLVILLGVVPAVALVVVWRSKPKKTNLLTQTYTATAPLWDLLLLVRNSLVVACVILLQYETEEQAIAVTLVLFLGILVHNRQMPFISEEINNLSLLSQAVLFITFPTALLVSHSTETVNALVYAVNILFLVHAVALMFLPSWCTCPSWFSAQSEGSSEKLLEETRNEGDPHFALKQNGESNFAIGTRVRIVDNTDLNGSEAVVVALGHASKEFVVELADRSQRTYPAEALVLIMPNEQPQMELKKRKSSALQRQNELDALDQEITKLKEMAEQEEKRNATLKREVQYLAGLKEALVGGED